MSNPLIGILVALREEASAVRAAINTLPEPQRELVRLVHGGVGPAMAVSAAQKLAQAPGLKWICSTGFCGGLDPTLPVGGIFLPKRMLAWTGSSPPPEHSIDAQTIQEAEQALQKAGLKFHTGTLATVTQPVFKVEEKYALALASGAQSVDMESAAVARLVFEKGLRFFAMRTVSDGANDALPDEVGTFLSAEGKVRIGKVTMFALGGPRNIRELWRLGQRSKEATQSLQAAWTAVLPVLLAEK